MKVKHEWTLLAVLAIVSVGGYRSLEGRAERLAREAEVEAETARALDSEDGLPDSLILSAPPLPDIAYSDRSEGLPDRGHWRGQSIFCDVNEDGRMDLVTSVRRWDRSTPADGLSVFLQGADGRWSAAVEGLRRDMGYGGSVAGDLDGDGHLDLVFSGHDVTPHVFLGDGAGAWRGTERLNIDFITSDVALGDGDGDGIADLAVLGFYPKEGGLVFFRGDGAGNFERFADVLPPTNYGADVDLEDLDGDGVCELLAATDVGVRVWRYDAELEWVEMSEGFDAPVIGGSELALAVRDLDGDGFAEIVRAGMSYDGHAPLAAFRREGEAWVPYGTGLPGDETYFDLVFAQLDKSPALELALAGKWGISVVRMTEPGVFERVGRLPLTEGVINTCVSDLDGDGIDELAYIGFGGPRVLAIADLDATSKGAGAKE